MEQGLISSIDNRKRNMNIEQKERLERLKRINKEKQYKKKIENDVLLLECKEALGAAGKILEQEEKDAVSPDTWLFSADYDEVIEFYHEGKITLGHSNLILGD